MSEYPMFKLASASVLVNGEAVDLLSFNVLGAEASGQPDRIQSAASRIIGQTFTFAGKGKIDMVVLVGLMMRYRLRELHQDLSRYTRWPYTN